MGLLLLIVLIMLLLGAVPAYPYSRDWGYAPSGILGFLLILLLISVFLGWLPWGWQAGPGPIIRP